MAWLVEVPPSPRHRKTRWQVRYQDGGRERSAGIYASPKAANVVKRQIEQGIFDQDVPEEATDPGKSGMRFGTYIQDTWWPTWEDQHPDSSYHTGKRIEKWILPHLGDLAFTDLDADAVGRWKGRLVTAKLAPQTINTCLALLATILNAAVDSDYLPRSPLMRKSGAGRIKTARREPVPRREVWLTRAQLDRLTEAITPRYRTLVLMAALTGMRWGELAALRWEDPQPDQALNDGAVDGVGRLRITKAISDPSRSGKGRVKGPKTEAGRRVIALDQETVDALKAHRELVGEDEGGLIFTTQGGSRGKGGMLARNNFSRIWKRALKEAKLADGWPEHRGLHFHDLRHTHATWLIAQRIPMIAIANRLGHANPVVTMMIYAHVDKLVERGVLTTGELGLPSQDKSGGGAG